MFNLHFPRGRAVAAAALAGVTALAGCAKDPELVLAPAPAASANAAFMARWVAIGNSITAGFQSGGLSEANQRSTYPALISRALGLSYSAPYVAGPGCAPLADAISAFRGALSDPTLPRPGGTACARTVASVTTLLNNVAVPGANSANVTNRPGSAGNPLTTLILGGRTQVEIAAAEAPTFVSVWIGNNDVLGAALGGDTTSATPLATFQANYDALLAGLATTPAVLEKHGLLIGVVDATNVPSVFTAQAIVNNVGGFRTAFEQAFLRSGRTLQILPNCTATTTSGVSLAYLLALGNTAQSLPANTAIPFACAPITASGQTFGTSGILDAAEGVALASRVAAYNAYIRQKADAMGWAYYDPNTTLARLKQNPAVIAPIPNLTSPTAPFGTALSLDGIHPSSATHVEIANDVIRVINAKYGSSIPAATAGPIP
jgi:lysophospholipase L1-like esterase